MCVCVQQGGRYIKYFAVMSVTVDFDVMKATLVEESWVSQYERYSF